MATRSSTLVSRLLTFCPPGPEDREVTKVSLPSSRRTPGASRIEPVGGGSVGAVGVGSGMAFVLHNTPRIVTGAGSSGMTVPMMHRLSALVIGLSFASVALAQDAASPEPSEPVEPAPDEGWTVSFEPRIWAPALLGDIGVGGAATFDVEDIDLDEPEATPAGRFVIRSDRITIEFFAYSFGVDESTAADRAVAIGGSAVAAGGAVDYELRQTGFELTVGYRVWDAPIGRNDPAGPSGDVSIGLDVYGGVRGFDIDLDFDTPAGESDELEDFHAILGLALRMDLPEGFGMEISVDGGGGADGSSFDLEAVFDYAFSENVSAQIGYRFLLMDLEEDGFEYETALAGLFGSVAIRF